MFTACCHCVLQHTIYRGPRDVARHVLANEGGLLGLFKGLGATLYRESIGNMFMFGVYELMKQQMVELKVSWQLGLFLCCGGVGLGLGWGWGWVGFNCLAVAAQVAGTHVEEACLDVWMECQLSRDGFAQQGFGGCCCWAGYRTTGGT
jgi:hypothetical protein